MLRKPSAISLLILNSVTLVLLLLLTACSKSHDDPKELTNEATGSWAEHACEMAVPEGLNQADFTCGTFMVPAYWDYPEGGRLSFEVAVLRAGNGSSKPDPLVFLGGGPGAWNIEGYLYREANSVLSPIAESSDIVFIDKRDNGLSNPCLFCQEYFDQFLQSYGVVADAAADVDGWLVGYQDSLKPMLSRITRQHSA